MSGRKKRLQALLVSEPFRRLCKATGYAGGYLLRVEKQAGSFRIPKLRRLLKIFEMYANGIGIVKICDILSKEQIVSPSVYAFKATGSRSGNPDLTRPYHWAQTTVRKMLVNQEYVGDTVNFKTYSKSNKLKSDPENILIFENTHEAIVARKTFELVQKFCRKKVSRQARRDGQIRRISFLR